MERRLAMIASVAFAFVVPNATQAQPQGASSASPALDEIYVARSVRLSRVPATSFCDKSNTEVSRANNEDQYIFRAVATNPTDGRVTDADSTTVGTLAPHSANAGRSRIGLRKQQVLIRVDPDSAMGATIVFQSDDKGSVSFGIDISEGHVRPGVVGRGDDE